MKIFLLLCLASGLASTEKLDRTYLPPPGSQFSGGSSGDIQVPFEYPKETFSTERPQLEDGSPEYELGINQRPKPTEPAQKPGFTYFQNSYSIPTTTTSYAITQTTTFEPVEGEEIEQPSGFFNGSTVQKSGFPKNPQTLAQTFQRRPNKEQSGQGPNYNQYQPAQSQPSFGSTTQKPQFPSNLIGQAYLPPVPISGSRGQPISGQDINGYPAGIPKGPLYQDGQQFPQTSRPIVNKPGFISPGVIQQNEVNATPNSPFSTSGPQYQNGPFGSTTGPSSNEQEFGSPINTDQNRNQFQGNQNFPSTTPTPQYRDMQPFSTPATVGQQQYFGNQNFPSFNISPQNGQQFFTTTIPSGESQNAGIQNKPSTAAPQYQNTQLFPTSGPFGQNQYIGNQNTIPSSVIPQSQDDQRFSTPGTVGQNRFAGIQNIPSSTAVPQYQYGQRFTTPGPAEQNQYVGNQNFPSSTITPQYENGQRFTTPGPDGQNRYVGNQNFPSSTAAPQYQNGQIISTPGSVRQNQFITTQNLPTTGAAQYQDLQRFPTTGPVGQNQFIGSQNFPSSTTAPQYQNGQGYTTPGTVQQIFGSRIPNNQNQFPGNQNIPSSTVSPQYQNIQHKPGSEHQYSENQNLPSSAVPHYQDGQRLTTPGSEGFGPISPTQQNLNKGYEDFLSATDASKFQNGQQFTTPASAQQNQFFGKENIPTTAIPQYKDGQRFTSAASRLPTGQTYQGQQLGNQQYPSTAAPQYQQTFSTTPGSNQQGFIPNQNIKQYPAQPGYNQQFPSSTTAQGFVPDLQQYGNDGIQTVPGTAVSFPFIQSTPGTETSPSYGNRPISYHTGASPQVYGTTPSPSPNYQGYPSTASPGNNLSSSPGSGVFAQNRPERPQAAFDRTAEILNYENVQTPEGYSYSYDTSNGIHADETGIVGNGTKAQGGFSYTGDDGKVYSVFYSADENGFQPRGDHLPTPPPIPEAIQRVIEQAHKDQESGISDDGSYNEDKYGYMKYDLPLTGLRLKNKTKPLVNGADIPNRYGNDFIKLNKKQQKLKGGNKQDNQGKDIIEQSVDADEQRQDNEEVYDDRRPSEGVTRIYSKRPTSMKDSVDDNQDNRTKSPNTNNFKNDLPGTRRPVGGNLRPKYVQNEENASDNESETNMPEDGEELQESQGAEYESDLVNYSDDPNSRTDFHGVNKYLPRPGSNQKRPLVRPDNINESVTVSQKSGKPINRKPQVSQDTVTDGQEYPSDPDYNRVPSRKNKFNQKMRGQSNVPSHNGIKLDSNGELGTYNDYETDGEPTSEDQSNRQYKYQNGKENVSKPTSPITKESNGINNKNIKTTDQETGYEYIPPQRKFESGVTFPPRLSITEKPRISHNVQKGSQTTLRPFMTPNVYDNNKEPIEDDDDLIDSQEKPYRPSSNENTNYPGYNKENVPNYKHPETYNNENDTTRKPSGQYETYPTRRPYGKPQTSTEQNTTGKNRYNQPGNNQGSRRPSNKPIYGTNIPNQGASKVESNAFVSTTPLPSSRPDANKDYQRPGQYQTTLRPTDGSPYYDETAPGKDGYIQKPIPNRPGLVNSRGQVLSTTYRPNYTFGDRTLAPSGSITVDGFGRPISSTKAPGYYPTYSVTENSRIPNSDELSGNGRPVEEKFRPSVGRFGVTSAPTLGTPGVYQGSTSAPIGEDFSGPKQPQRFDPESGYHYK